MLPSTMSVPVPLPPSSDPLSHRISIVRMVLRHWQVVSPYLRLRVLPRPDYPAPLVQAELVARMVVTYRSGRRQLLHYGYQMVVNVEDGSIDPDRVAATVGHLAGLVQDCARAMLGGLREIERTGCLRRIDTRRRDRLRPVQKIVWYPWGMEWDQRLTMLRDGGEA